MFTVKTSENVKLPLYLRAPKLSEAPEVSINRKDINITAEPLSYNELARGITSRNSLIKFDRLLSDDDDNIRLELPMTLEI